MSPFDQLRAMVDAVRAASGQILRESVRECAPQIEDEIIRQLQRGERGDGEMLPDYSPVSVTVYGKRPGPMTLYDTGDFYHEISVEVDDDGFTITNNDSKAAKLAINYGREILELQSQSFVDVRNETLNESISVNINRVITYGSI